jgi:MFS family permease
VTEEVVKSRKSVVLDNHSSDSLITTVTNITYFDGTHNDVTKIDTLSNNIIKPNKEIKKSILLNQHDFWLLIFLVFIQIVFVTMVYGPIAAFLVEMFPAKIRYTSMSLPYHIGNGIFGGLLPLVATYLVTTAKVNNDPEWYLNGLWYPIIVGAVCFVIGMIYLNKNDNRIEE